MYTHSRCDVRVLDTHDMTLDELLHTGVYAICYM